MHDELFLARMMDCQGNLRWNRMYTIGSSDEQSDDDCHSHHRMNLDKNKNNCLEDQLSPIITIECCLFQNLSPLKARKILKLNFISFISRKIRFNVRISLSNDWRHQCRNLFKMENFWPFDLISFGEKRNSHRTFSSTGQLVSFLNESIICRRFLLCLDIDQPILSYVTDKLFCRSSK